MLRLIDILFIKEKIEMKVINLSYISSTRQIADVMTMSQTVKKFEESQSWE